MHVILFILLASCIIYTNVDWYNFTKGDDIPIKNMEAMLDPQVEIHKYGVANDVDIMIPPHALVGY